MYKTTIAFVALLVGICLYGSQPDFSLAQTFDQLPYVGPSRSAQPLSLGGDRKVHEVLNSNAFNYGDRY